MTRKKWLALVLVISLVGGGVYFLWPRPESLAEARLKAHWALPDSPASRSPPVALTMNGLDVLKEVPEFPCDREFHLEVSGLTYQYGVFRGVIVALRRPGEGDEAFTRMDFSRDQPIAINFMPNGSGPKKAVIEPRQFTTVPGEYRVRYYLSTRIRDRENDPVPTKELLGEGRIRLLPPAGNGGKNARVPSAASSAQLPSEITS